VRLFIIFLLIAAAIASGVEMLAHGGPTTVKCVTTATGKGDYCYESPGGGGAVDGKKYGR
jgi:hypothetical protein